MKFSFFGQKIVLDDYESETLKVALLDAEKQVQYERSLLDVDSNHLPPVIAKANRLNELKEILGLNL